MYHISLHHREWFNSFHQAQVHAIWCDLIQFLLRPTGTLSQTLQLEIHFDTKQSPKEIARWTQYHPVCIVRRLSYSKFDISMVWVIDHLPPLHAEGRGRDVDPWSFAVHWKLWGRRNARLSLCMRVSASLVLGSPVCRCAVITVHTLLHIGILTEFSMVNEILVFCCQHYSENSELLWWLLPLLLTHHLVWEHLFHSRQWLLKSVKYIIPDSMLNAVKNINLDATKEIL